MNKRDIFIGLIILAILATVVYWLRKPGQPTPEIPMAPAAEEKFESAFNLEIPEDVDKAILKDVSGGMASGIATRRFEDNQFSHAVLADLADPEAGSFYQAWLIRGKEGDLDFAQLSTGKLRIAKGGWLLEYQSKTNYSDYNDVLVSLEKIFDQTPESHILEGSF